MQVEEGLTIIIRWSKRQVRMPPSQVVSIEILDPADPARVRAGEVVKSFPADAANETDLVVPLAILEVLEVLE